MFRMLTKVLVTGLCIRLLSPILPASVSIAASANPVYAGTAVTLSATPTNGGTPPTYQWKKGGLDIPGAIASTYIYVPTNGDVISVVMTSNANPCMTGSPATSNSISMTVKPLPQLQMNVNGVVVTNANDGTDDAGNFAVCNTGSNNIDITQVAEQLGVTSSTLVKVRRVVTTNNVYINMGNSTNPISAYTNILPWQRYATLLNSSLPGTIEMRFQVWMDSNNNNIPDANEGIGDWIVYNVTVTNCAKSAEITTSTFDTPQMELSDLKVYPNPFSDRLRFEFSAPNL